MPWPIKNLGEVISTIESGKRPKGGAVSSGIPSVGVEHISDSNGFKLDGLKYIPEDFYKSLNKGKLNRGDILIAKDGATTGKTVFLSDDFPFSRAAANEHIFILRGKNEIVNQKFLFYILYSPRGQKQVLKTKHGAAQGGIDQSFVNFVKIPLPPLEIQKQIVERMDKIAEAQKMNDELIQKADELFQSLLHQELDSDSKTWEVKKLGDLAGLITKGTTPTTYGHQFTGSGIPFLRAEDVCNNAVDYSNVQYHISEETNKFLNRSQAKANDILITIAGTIGRIGYVPEDAPAMNMNQAVAIVRLDKLIDFMYVFFLLQNKELRRNMFGAQVTGTIANLSLTNIRNLKIPLPPLKIQKQIIEKLFVAQEYKTQLLAKKLKLKELFDSVLVKSFNGNL